MTHIALETYSNVFAYFETLGQHMKYVVKRFGNVPLCDL